MKKLNVQWLRTNEKGQCVVRSVVDDVGIDMFYGSGDMTIYNAGHDADYDPAKIVRDHTGITGDGDVFLFHEVLGAAAPFMHPLTIAHAVMAIITEGGTEDLIEV